MAQRLSIGSDRASLDHENIDVLFPVPLLGTDKKSIKCYAQLSDDFTLAISLIWWKFAVKGAGLLRGTMNDAEYPGSPVLRTPPPPHGAPGLSLAGVRLVIPDHAMGLPVLRTFSLCICYRHYPGAASGLFFARCPRRISLPRKGCRVDLRIVLVESKRGAVAWAMRHRSVSSPRSSNRTWGPPSGSRTRHQVFALGRL
jgi:hypothetical protein